MVEKESISRLSHQAVSELQIRLPDKIIIPGHANYHEARMIWNGFIDRYPAAIIHCTNTSDVAEAIYFARVHELEIAIRGGGHSYPGYSAVDGGIVIDLSSMKAVLVDPQRQTALVSAGVKLGEMIQATERYGLVTPVGTATDTGIAGLTLGGGFGFLTGKYGLTCDNVLSYSMVTAEGDVVNASAAETPDLFWGLRGGGCNFGVVTSFEFQLHPLTEVLGGMLIYPMPMAGEVLRYYRAYCDQSPDEVTVYAGLISSPEGQPVIAVIPCYSGDLHEGERVLAPLRKYRPPVADLIRPMSYLDMVSLLDPRFPGGMNYYDKGCMFSEFSDEVIEQTILAAASQTSPLSAVVIQQAHGAFSRIPVQSTAFAARGANNGSRITPGKPKINCVGGNRMNCRPQPSPFIPHLMKNRVLVRSGKRIGWGTRCIFRKPVMSTFPGSLRM